MRPIPQTLAMKSTMTYQLERLAPAASEGVTIVCGFPASGKSTAAAHLTELVGAVLIDKDTFAPALEEAVMAELSGNPHDRDSTAYMRVVNPHIYSAILYQAFLAGAHTPVVVDAPFLGHLRVAAQQGLSLSHHIAAVTPISAPPIRTLWVAATPDQIRERMARRGAPRDAGKLADWNTYRTTVLEDGTAELAAATVDYVVRN